MAHRTQSLLDFEETLAQVSILQIQEIFHESREHIQMLKKLTENKNDFVYKLLGKERKTKHAEYLEEKIVFTSCNSFYLMYL